MVGNIPSISRILLAVSILFSTYISSFAFIAPNPNPEKAHSNDRARIFTGKGVTYIPVGILSVFSVSHAVIILFWPDLPNSDDAFNPSLFSWSVQTVIPIVLILLGVPLRLAAYRNLGKNFTFRLAEPDALVTSGLYVWIQHPGYTGLLTVQVANIALLARSGGVMAAVPGIGPWLRNWEVFNLGFAAVAMLLATRLRVRDEERMLKAKFGKEWEDWHGRTKRFIPGII